VKYSEPKGGGVDDAWLGFLGKGNHFRFPSDGAPRREVALWCERYALVPVFAGPWVLSSPTAIDVGAAKRRVVPCNVPYHETATVGCVAFHFRIRHPHNSERQRAFRSVGERPSARASVLILGPIGRVWLGARKDGLRTQDSVSDKEIPADFCGNFESPSSDSIAYRTP